jgi:hypothetical protein
MHPELVSALSREQVRTWHRTAEQYRFARTTRPSKSRTPWRRHARTRVRLGGAVRGVPASTC